MRRISLVLVACALLAACGTGDREADVAAVAERFHEALAEGDGAAACAELGEEAVASLERQEETACEAAVLELDLPAGATATAAEVYVTSAHVTLSGGASAFLDEGPAGWRISAAGCRVTAPDMPQDCELEG